MVDKLLAKFQEEKMICKTVLQEFTKGTSIQDFQLRALVLSSMAYYYKDGPFIRKLLARFFVPSLPSIVGLNYANNTLILPRKLDYTRI